MKKRNVLIVEDSKKQIKWIKESVENCDLADVVNITIVGTKEEFLDMNLDSFDIILTDLFLPESTNGKPDHLVGFSIIDQLIDLVLENKLSACGLVSNFEHHSDEMNYDTEDYVWKKVRAIRSFDNPNIIVVFDASWNSYEHFMSPSLDVYSKSEIKKMGKAGVFYNGQTCAEVLAVNDHGYIYLKDYAGIIKKLLDNLE